jgi:hypothetical protein
VGLVGQSSEVFHNKVAFQRGFLAGVSHKKLELTYVFIVGMNDATPVLKAGLIF